MGKSIMLNGHTNTKEGEGKEEQSHHDKSAEGDDHEKPAYPTIEKRRSSPYTDEQVYASHRTRTHRTRTHRTRTRTRTLTHCGTRTGKRSCKTRAWT